MRLSTGTSTLAESDFRLDRRKITRSPKEEQPAKLGSSDSLAVVSLSLSLSASRSVPRVRMSPFGAGATSRRNTT
jgi:hypothetical protein